MIDFFFTFLFKYILASLYEVMSISRLVGWLVGWSLTRFFQMLKISGFLHENHWDSPTFTLENVFGMLGVLNSGWHVNSVKDLYI